MLQYILLARRQAVIADIFCCSHPACQLVGSMAAAPFVRLHELLPPKI